MTLDAATLQLIILATPGILWAMLDASNRPPAQNQQFVYTLRVFVFGLISLSLVGVGYAALGRPFQAFEFSPAAQFSDKLDEILWSIPVAVAMALLWIANRSHGWVTSALRTLGVWDYSGTDDIWEYALCEANGRGKYVYVRDYENGLTYFGYVRSFSDRPDIRELYLEDVEVYELHGAKQLYNLEAIYMTLKFDAARVEFPTEGNTNDGR